MKQSSIWATATKKVNDFYASNIAIIFFMSATTIFALLQVILYSLGMMQVNGHKINEVTSQYPNWILLAMSIIGCYAGFIGGILLFRGSLSFVYWQTTSTTFAIITQALASMWFGAFCSAYFIMMNIIRFWAWKNDKLTQWNWSPKKVIMVGAIILFVVVTTLYILCGFCGENIYASSAWMQNKNYYFDATGASLNITASFLMLFKSRWAFVLYAIAKVFTITNYAEAGLIVPIVQMILFWIMDATGFIGWSLPQKIEEPIEIPFEDYMSDLVEKNKGWKNQ